MIFHGRINICDTLEMSDGKKLFELRMSDVSKPSSLRTGGEFITYLSEEKRKKLPEGDIADELVTMRIKEAGSGKGGGVKLKGDLVAGIIPLDKFAQAAAQNASGSLPEKPAASASK